MATGKIGKLFSGRDGRRDWDEVEEDDEYEEDELEDSEEEDEEDDRSSRRGLGRLFSRASEDDEDEEEDEEDEQPGKGGGLLASVGSFLHSRRSEAEEDEDEEEEEDDEEEEAPRGAGLRGLFSRRKAGKKDDDYDYDDNAEPVSAVTAATGDEEAFDDFLEDGFLEEDYVPGEYSVSEAAPEAPVEEVPAEDYTEEYAAEDYTEEYAPEEYTAEDYAEEYAPEEYTAEDYAEEYAPEEYTAEDYAEEYAPEEYTAEDYTEEYAPEDYTEEYDPEAYAPEEGYETETLFEEGASAATEEYDPFAALAFRAANPEADYAEEDYDEDYADDEGYEEAYYDDSDEDYEEEYAEDEADEAYDDFDEEIEPRRKSRAARSSRSRGNGGTSKFLFPALCVIALCALAAIAFAVLTLLGTSAGKEESPVQSTAPVQESSAPVAESENTDPTAGMTPAEIQAQGLATPNPAEGVSSVKAKLDDAGRIVPDVGGAVVPNRGTKLSLDDFAGSAMIGNSFVEGMNLWSDIDTLKYICADGVSLDNMIGNYLYYVTVQNYNSIYLCLGLNEIGWSADTFISKYEKVIDYIRSDGTAKTQNATIYICSVMPVEEIMETVPGESGSTISKSTILEFNERLKKMCEEKGCWYLDVYSALADGNGYLPDSIAADDHVHFEKTGYSIWTNYLQTHYVDEGLLGE